MSTVFVSGCFDLLHTGHIRFLEEAASYGDLYVGVASDQTILTLKGHRPTFTEQERLYMIRSIKYVKDAWINSGVGVMDFLPELETFHPDILFVNHDGVTDSKVKFCQTQGIQLIIHDRKPFKDLPTRSSTSIKKQLEPIPYRVELCGGWMDQPLVNKVYHGSVVTVSISPTHPFMIRSGMATSSRHTALELWGDHVPEGDRTDLARALYYAEHKKGFNSGSQDHLGMMLPGVNLLSYSYGIWPETIESLTDHDTLQFIHDHIFLYALHPRKEDFDPMTNTNITLQSAMQLADSSLMFWQAIKHRDVSALGRAMNLCYEAQVKMFPTIETEEVKYAREYFNELVAGCKLTGAGGGGYMVLASELPIGDAIQIYPVGL